MNTMSEYLWPTAGGAQFAWLTLEESIGPPGFRVTGARAPCWCVVGTMRGPLGWLGPPPSGTPSDGSAPDGAGWAPFPPLLPAWWRAGATGFVRRAYGRTVA